jgi:murein DD-endopeptidase MepM/ murein hydrolase activator NlpD
MSKDNCLYTFILATTSSSKVRRFSVHHKALRLAGGVIIVLTLVMAFGMFRLAQHESLNLKYLSAKAENEKLKKENHAYENSYAKLKGQISYIEDLSRELSRQARMEAATEVDEQVGIGGPETVASMEKAADTLERNIRQVGDRLRSELLRLASIPSGLPINGYISDGFGIRRNPFGGGGREFHEGLDIAADFGTPVNATADGLVIWAAPHAGYGNAVVLYHSNGITTRYGHLSRISVEAGQRVRRGDQIGNVGSTGRSTGPHVHYEVRENDQPVSPERYLGQARP